MKTEKLLTLGALGVGAWFLYEHWGTMFGTVAAAGPTQTSTPVATPAPVAVITGGTTPAPAPPPPAATPAPPAITSPAPPDLVTALKQAAGASSGLNADQWDYFRNKLYPPDLTPTQFGTAFPSPTSGMTAEDFVAALHKVGLAGYQRGHARTMVRTNRVNYRRAS